VPTEPAATEAPYGIGEITFTPGLAPAEMADLLAFLPDQVATIPRGGASSDSASATVVYVLQENPNAPNFGVVVALNVEPSDDAAAFITELQRMRWGDPTDHNITATGDGADGQPAFREFSRTFPATLFALPNRPVYFLLWYRAGDDYAFMIVADSPATREALARAVAETLR
jgi:hypothetical protein